LRLKAIDARILFVEAAMNAPRRPAFPQWKIDLVRDALTFIEGEMGGWRNDAWRALEPPPAPP
jgi:hypothetical protein